MELHGVDAPPAPPSRGRPWWAVALAPFGPHAPWVAAVALVLLLLNFVLVILPVGIGIGIGTTGDHGHDKTAAHFSRAVVRLRRSAAGGGDALGSGGGGGGGGDSAAAAAAIAASVQQQPPRLQGTRAPGTVRPPKRLPPVEVDMADSVQDAAKLPAAAAGHPGAGNDEDGVPAVAAAAATKAWWTTESRGVLASYLGASFSQGCAQARCMPALRAVVGNSNSEDDDHGGAGVVAGHAFCCDSSPVAVVIRDDLVARAKAAPAPMPLWINVTTDGRLSSFAPSVSVDSTLACSVLAALPGPAKELRLDRCQAGTDPAAAAAAAATAAAGGVDKLPRALPYYAVYQGVGDQPVCVSREGRVRQLGPGGVMLGDELGRPCTAMADVAAPAFATGESIPAGRILPPSARLVVLTQPWAHIQAHWITEAFMRLGAVWDLVGGRPDTVVHAPNVTARMLTQLATVGVAATQVVAGEVCAHRVIVPMLSNCGQPASGAVLQIRQLTWAHVLPPGGLMHTVGDPWAYQPPAPGEHEVVAVMRRPSGRIAQHEALVAFLRRVVGPRYAVVEVPTDAKGADALAGALRVLHNATAVVTVHGAGAALTYACRPGTMLVDVILPHAVRILPARLAQAAGLAYHALVAEGALAASDEKSITLNPGDFGVLDAVLRRHLPSLGSAPPTAAGAASPPFAPLSDTDRERYG